MDGFWSSATKWFSEKTSSPLYFTYLGFFIAWNWRLFQIIFLESSTLFQGPRIEYIAINLYLHSSYGSLVDWLLNFGWHVVPPMVLTYVAISWFPYIQKWALSNYLESRFERKRMFEIKKIEYNEWLLDQEKHKSQTLKEIATEKVQQVESEKVINTATTDEEKWAFEYKMLVDQGVNIDQAISSAEKAIYGYSGYYTTEPNNFNSITIDSLSLLDGIGLITFNQTHNAIEFTNKGKHFLRASKIRNAF